MSTRSLIAHEKDGAYESIYCHFSGYPEHHGPILLDHYATEARVSALLDLGDLSVLGRELGEQHSFDAASRARNESCCLAYGRDRGETGVSKEVLATEEKLLARASDRWAVYVYLFRGGRWYYRKVHGGRAWLLLEQHEALRRRRASRRFSTTPLSGALLLIPESVPPEVTPPYGIAPGYYSRNAFVELLRQHRNNPDAIYYLADMLEE